MRRTSGERWENVQGMIRVLVGWERRRLCSGAALVPEFVSTNLATRKVDM